MALVKVHSLEYDLITAGILEDPAGQISRV
jgi:hypothetical protein